MAIWGGDGSTRDQAVICNTFEDLKTLLEATTEARGLKYKHIALDDSIPVGSRIMDLRKEGWYTNYINIPDSNTNDVYLYGNNWTILGPSILSGSLIYKNCYTVLHISNLTIKNAYVYANSNTSCVLSGGNYYFEKCKFSATLDGSTNHFAYFINKTTTSGRIDVYQCSFNVKLHKYARLHDYLSFNATVNSLINFESSYLGVKSSSSYVLYGNSSRTWTLFTKLTGNIKFMGGSDSTSIFFQSNSGYNVVDINFSSSDGANYTAYLEGGSSSVSIWNTERCGTNITPSIGSSIASVTTADMVNKNYLESINFLVGDMPTI